MNAVLSAADLVLSRAGAGAIAEIVRCRVPSVLVPYPHAADNHQYLNASFLERKGGGIVCLEEKLDDILFDEIREVMFNEEFRAILRRNLFSMDGGDVAGLLASDLIQSLKDRPARDSVPGGVLRMVG
jgi:UDP-N-acetylglucosamine--N-acetylmuramyl-(pentapeptide) pyrophosphoryl-undecaprenol N-acetylglucosamine transferase